MNISRTFILALLFISSYSNSSGCGDSNFVNGEITLSSDIAAKNLGRMSGRIWSKPFLGRIEFEAIPLSWSIMKDKKDARLSINPFIPIASVIPGFLGFNKGGFCGLGFVGSAILFTQLFDNVQITYPVLRNIIRFSLGENTDYFLLSPSPSVYTESTFGVQVGVKHAALGIKVVKPWLRAFLTDSKPFLVGEVSFRI